MNIFSLQTEQTDKNPKADKTHQFAYKTSFSAALAVLVGDLQLDFRRALWSK